MDSFICKDISTRDIFVCILESNLIKLNLAIINSKIIIWIMHPIKKTHTRFINENTIVMEEDIYIHSE